MRLIAIALILASCAARPPLEKQRGMSYACSFSRERDVRYGSPASAEALSDLKAMGVNWISIMPFAFHRGEPRLRFGGERVWETDESLVAVTKQAHELGIKVLLKPHVWGRAELSMDAWDAAQWRSWFDDYSRFIEHYARLGRDAGVDAFSIGNEQKIASRNEAEWRAIIARVRAIYSGPVTYGANFDEVFDVRFWDALDFIGVSAYFPLASDATPSRDALVRAWQPLIARLGELSRQYDRPIVFTELGYRSADGAAWRQWELPRDAPLNLDAQRVAYEAFFEAVWPQPWLAGVYPWKWESYRDHSGPRSNDYHLEHKPAAEVVQRAYSK
ncbi:MAG TPA: hypothetical protein VNA69_10575 [Thermoanaerobaculia bacterium]|nr:hypothetical protein [Thermoanaerobaculia bacterium]